MGKKKMFTFLGTGRYAPATYEYNNQSLKETKYIQLAVYELLEKWYGFTEDDEVYIILTPEAKGMHWESDNESDSESNLKTSFSRINPKAAIHTIEIENEVDEILDWNLFHHIIENINEGDLIYFDVTHGFRSFPLIAINAVNYAQTLYEGVTLESIFYGKYTFNAEVHPIVDLTTMAKLSDWSFAVQTYLNTGDADKLFELSMNEFIITGDHRKNSNQQAIAVRKLSGSLVSLSNSVRTSRNEEILKSIDTLSRALEELKDKILFSVPTFMHPISELFPVIEERLLNYKDYSKNETKNFFIINNIVKYYCLEHGLIQQGFTLLLENFISYCCFLCNRDYLNIDDREEVKIYLNILSNRGETKKVSSDEIDNEIIDVLDTHISEDLSKEYYNLNKYRNDINHAAFNDSPMKSGKFKDKLMIAEQIVRNFMTDGEKLSMKHID